MNIETGVEFAIKIIDKLKLQAEGMCAAVKREVGSGLRLASAPHTAPLPHPSPPSPRSRS